MISIMEGHLSSEDDTIREWSTRVFITMFQKQPDKNFIDPTLKNIIIEKLRMYNLDNRKEDAARLIQSLKLMIFSAKELRLQDKLLRLCEITNRDQPFSIAQAQVIGALAPTISSQVFHKRLYTSVMTSLEEELNAESIDNRERIQHVLMAYAELMSNIPPEDVSALNDQLTAFYSTCSDNNRPEFYVDFISHFCENTRCDIEIEATTYLENVLRYMNHSDTKLIEKVIAAMNAIFKKVSKETQFSFVPIIKESIEKVCVQFVGLGSPLLERPLEHRYAKKVPHLTILGYPAGVKCLVEVAQAAIMHGNIQVRTDAAFCFKYILDFAPELGKGEIVKICGALIRVANDRFPQELKLQIYYALRFIQTKGGPSAKGFQVNMQTTYTKAIGDPASIHASRRIILENLILLVQGLPRIDPIVKDLNALIDGTKIDGDQKTSVSECLALIIRSKGKVISSAVSQNIYKTMTDIINEQQGGGTNDRIFTNCATALAFLSAYASNASQMQALFTAYDESAVDAITLPLKFAVLINGNDTIDKSSLVNDFQTLLIERLTDSAGFEEIDDDPSPINTEDESEVFHFKGALDTLSYMLDKFARREICQKQDSPMMKMIYQCVNQSTIFKKLHQEDSIGIDSYKLLCKFAAEAPIKPVNNGASFTNECAEMTKDILECMQKFYLDNLGQALQDSQDALSNILQLNYDNYTNYSDDLVIQSLTKPQVKTAIDSPFMQGVISDDMKLYAVDILFKKK